MSKGRRTLRVALRVLPILGGIALLAVVMVWMSHGFGERIQPGKDAYQGETDAGREKVVVQTLTTTDVIDAVGAVQPRNLTSVASQILATIQQIHVRASERVEAGQPLVTLDDREIRAQLGEAEAGLTAAEAGLTLRQSEFARYQQLYADKAVTREEYDRFEGALRVTQAQVERARQQVVRINVMLSYTQITAPAEGVVVERFADPGDLAAPGKPLLAILDPQDLELHANIRESLAAGIKTGMQLDVRIDAVGLQVPGVIREIVPQAETASRSVLAKVALPPEETQGLYLGMFGRLAIPVGRSDRVVLDRRAIQRVGQLELADVVTDGGFLERRYVRTGRRFGDVVEILAGLRVGEVIALPADAAEAGQI